MNKAKLYNLFVFVILMLSISACNLPSEEAYRSFIQKQTEDAAIQYQETLQFESRIQTAQANIPVSATEISEAAHTETSEKEEELIQRQTNSSEKLSDSTPTADPNRVAPDLPNTFQTDLLNPLDYPHTYVENTCTLLKNRWGANKATPGTIVMVVMYHSITKGEVTLDNQVSVEEHKQVMQNLKDQGFVAITMEQFIAFMTNNDYIPERSALLIVDDRHSEEFYTDHWKSFYDDWGWPVVNAWISSEGTTQELWDGNARVEAEGYVDHQAHGVIHNQNMNDASSDDFLIGELKGSIDAIQAHFGKTPHAIIWPGGGFGYRPIEIAKEYDYKVGFTVNPRGPVMYNWVPLCDEQDPARPSYMMDGKYDPLFVIPRYWDTDVSTHIDTVRQIGKAAKEEIYANQAVELEYYDIVCKAEFGDI